MFDELNKYNLKDHFFLKSTDSLGLVCNAPTDKNGVYIVYALKNGKIDLVYIGSSGKKLADGSMKTRQAGLGGIKDRLVNGHQFGKVPRRISWPIKILTDDIESLDVYWYITHDATNNDCPLDIEDTLLVRYLEIYGKLPLWNKKFPRNR